VSDQGFGWFCRAGEDELPVLLAIIDGISHGIPHFGNTLPLVDQPWGGSLEENGGLSESSASHRDVSVEAHLGGSKLARG